MAAAPEIIQPARHILAMPEDCECGMCTPSWARRRGKSRRYSELVTLADALGREDSAARPAMIAQHAACLLPLTAAAVRAVTAEPGDDLGAPEVGLPVLIVARELAAPIQPGQVLDHVPAHLVHASQ